MFNQEDKQKLIDFIETDDNFLKQVGSENAFVWEKSLISDYWKNWREEIKTAQSEKDAKLLAHKIMKLRGLILWNTNAYKKGICDAEFLRKSIENKEKELKDITREEWDFFEKLDKEFVRFFTSGNESEEDLIGKISELKAEIERLKNLKVDSDFGKANVKKYSQKLEQQLQNSQFSLEALQNNNNNPKKFPILPIIGIVCIVSLLTLFIYKLKKTKK